MRLVTPRGIWSYPELASDPFGLQKLAQHSGHISLASSDVESIVSVAAMPDGSVPEIRLGHDRPVIAGKEIAGKENEASIETRWVLRTSGTSSSPKLVTKLRRELLRTGLKRGKPAVWSFLTDPSRMAGLQVILEALHRKDSLVVAHAIDGLPGKLEFLRQFGVSSLSLTPSQARMCLGTREFFSLDLNQITLGGEIADQPLLSELARACPKSRVTHVYATTEIGPIVAVSDGMAGIPLSTKNTGGFKLQVSEGGELVVCSANNEITATGDLVRLSEDRLHFVGRSSSFINVGGAKVSPERVEQTLLQIPWVSDCRVFGRASAQLGQVVAAEVILDETIEEFESKIRSFCRATLERHEIPLFIYRVDRMTLSETGKKERS